MVKNKKGFTLLEILLVITIIVIMVAMVAPNLSGRGKQARNSAARVDIDSNMATALDMYELDNGTYPSTEQGLRALIQKPSSSPEPMQWNGPYLKKKKTPKDPWGKPYMYSSPGSNNIDEYDLYSLGPDGTESEDDITNWDDDFDE